MKPQHFRVLDQEVVGRFIETRKVRSGEQPKLRLAWVGTERLENSAWRLERNGIQLGLHRWAPRLPLLGPGELELGEAREVGGIPIDNDPERPVGWFGPL